MADNRECPRCGGPKYRLAEVCTRCADEDAVKEMMDSYEAMMLEDVTTVEELKEWIKEHLLLPRHR